jgi:Mn2+/Fe2+ NRAMP family transporter
MTPFEFYFYSSGAIEEEWDAKELLTNRVTALVGSGFGGVTILALMLGAGVVLFPQRADVKSLADAAGPIETSLGGTGLALFLLGTFGVSLGAGLENALSGAYSVCQCFGWDWGKKGRPREAPLFHLVYLTMLVVAVGLALSGLDPIGLATATMALAGATLPFTFVPLLIVANDADYMGQQRNTRSMNLVAWVVLGLLLVVTLATLPLLVLAGGGS